MAKTSTDFDNDVRERLSASNMDVCVGELLSNEVNRRAGSMQGDVCRLLWKVCHKLAQAGNAAAGGSGVPRNVYQRLSVLGHYREIDSAACGTQTILSRICTGQLPAEAFASWAKDAGIVGKGGAEGDHANSAAPRNPDIDPAFASMFGLAIADDRAAEPTSRRQSGSE